MNSPSDILNPETHAGVFVERVIPSSGLNEAISHDRPKAIILGGQPGAGKGGLAREAVRELNGDVVSIDPDDLREHHPRIKEFRSENPYNWSTRTQKDAGNWADELRKEAVAGKKNFIFDTTLSDGQWTAGLVKELQKAGYDVEVRVVATHKLESEHGVDERFAKSLDAKGHGRYVPEGAREAIYNKVPASLDTIRSETNAPIRIFNREGKELYDSRHDARQPGQVLQEAREARLSDPRITRGLNEGWEEQKQWHERLPETITHNPKIAPETAQRLLNERRALNVVEGVQRDAAHAASVDYAMRIHPSVMKGARIAGAAATLYDAGTTAAHTSDLLHQGNRTGAQSQVEHFATRNLGGWGGAVAGAELLGAAGIESGPLDLFVAGAGGIGGAVLGDKIADWRDQQRIYSQTDPQGNTWHLDPKQPQQGWTRIVQTDQLDTDAMRFSDGIPVYKMRTETAQPAVAAHLTFQANNAAADLALANPPTPRDPYRQPAGPNDTRSQLDAPWKHDAQTQLWSRTVTDEMLEHGIKITHVETASPQRAAELNAAAQHTIAENLAQSPHGIAEHYRNAYEQNDWAKYGPMQPSVTNALKAPESTLQASDGKTYTHGTDGQWTTPGLLWGTNAAEGNIRAELNATAQMAASQKQPPTQSVPQATVKTAPEPPPPIPEHLRDFRHPDHPMNSTYQTMLGHVHAMENANGIRHGEHSERTAAVLADRQSADRLGYVKQVELHDNGRHTDIHLVTRDPAHSSAQPDRVTSVRSDDAIAKPVEQVSHDWSRRELPHIYQHQVREPEPPARDPSTLQADDPRRMDHPRHAQFDALRERIGAAYAQYGIVRSEGQLDRATAAVMLDLQKNDAHWQMPDRVKLTVDPQTGKAGPGSGIMTDNTQSLLHNMTVTQGAAMQQAPEASFQQMNQVAQQQTQQAQIQAAQTQTQRQQQGPAL
jgi:predicted ABC-type ATPase